MLNNLQNFRSLFVSFAFGLSIFGAVTRPTSAQPLPSKYTAEQLQQLDEAEKLTSKVETLFSEGKEQEAIPFAKKALAISEKVLGVNHPESAFSLNRLLTLEIAAGNRDAAITLMDKSRRGARRQMARVLPALSQKEQSLYLERNDDSNFHTALSLGLAQRQNPEAASLSASWLLNGKGVMHTASTERAIHLRSLADPARSSLLRQMLEIRHKLATLTLNDPKPGQQASQRDAFDKLTADENQLTWIFSEMGEPTMNADPWVELTRVRKSLSANSVLIDIVRFSVVNFQAKEKKYQPARYVAWIVPPADKGSIQIVDLGPADVIDAAGQEARKIIQSAVEKESLLKQQGELVAEEQATQSLQKLSTLIWKPLAEKLGDATQVILSPDGLLWLVPWSALPIAENKLLLETYSLRYVVSGRDIVRPEPTTLTRSAPIILADPNFDLSAEETRQAIQAVFPNRMVVDQNSTNRITKKIDLPHVPRLPNSAMEAKAIAPNIERFSKSKVQIYTDGYALESVIKSVQRPSLLVLSTHAFFLPNQDIKLEDDRAAPTDTKTGPLAANENRFGNPLARCGLLLAGCNSKQPTAVDDGILTGLEIIGIDLRGTELVVLNASETGVGEIHNGEGVIGLRQAFQLAGANSVVASLWEIPDRDSMFIIIDFFQNLADGQSKSDALRNAQLKRIQARRDRYGAAHPFFWAAWTLTGE